MKLIPESLRDYPNVREHNWLIHYLIIRFLKECAEQYASGIMADIGCGAKPYQPIFAPFVSRHIGVDLAESPHNISKVDVIGSAYHTNLEGSSCNVVLCTEVLEHLEEPQEALKELSRILMHQGVVILTVPFFWHVHEAPRDFYRYSEYGLRHLFEQADFEIVEIQPLTGFIVTFSQLSIYFLRRFQRGYVLRTIGRILNWGLQYLALALNRYDSSTDFTNLYGLVARKITEVHA